MLIVKLTRPEPKCCEVLSEMSVEGVLTAGQWHHLAINVREFMQAKKTKIEVS